jgi:hypothetical protein
MTVERAKEAARGLGQEYPRCTSVAFSAAFEVVPYPTIP